MTCGIYYYWDNEKDELAYIGYSNNLKRRDYEHRTSKNSRIPFDLILQNNIERYSFELMLECDEDDLSNQEAIAILLYKPKFNFQSGGNNVSGSNSPMWGKSVIEDFGGIGFIEKCYKKGLTQKDIGDIVGLSQGNIAEYVKKRKFNWYNHFDIIMDNGGVNFIKCCNQKGMTQQEIADKINLPIYSINRFIKDNNIKWVKQYKSGKDNPNYGSIVDNYGGKDFVRSCKKKGMTQKDISNLIGLSLRSFLRYLKTRNIKWKEL